MHKAIIIFVVNKHVCPCKDQASVTVSSLSLSSFQSGNKELPTPSEAFNKPEAFLNSRVCQIVSQVSQYIKDNFEHILQTVLEARLPAACRQDWKIFKDLPEQVFKSKTPDIHKDKSNIDCYHFIQ